MRKILNHIAKNKRWYLIGCAIALLVCYFLPLFRSSDPIFAYQYLNFTLSIEILKQGGFDLIFIVAPLGFFINIVMIICFLFKKINFSLLSFVNIITGLTPIFGAVEASVAAYLLVFFSLLMFGILFLREKAAKSK